MRYYPAFAEEHAGARGKDGFGCLSGPRAVDPKPWKQCKGDLATKFATKPNWTADYV
jgi:hypothetical protein